MIDTTTFLVIVSAMGTAITGLAGLLYRTLQKNMELTIKLEAYQQNAPELVAAIRDWIAASERSSLASSPSSDSPSPSSPSSRRTLPRKRRTT